MSERIDVPLVRRLISEQFPEWARLPIEPVPSAGTDNAVLRRHQHPDRGEREAPPSRSARRLNPATFSGPARSSMCNSDRRFEVVSRIGIAPRVVLAVIAVALAALAVGSVGVAAAPQGPKTPHPKGVKVSRGATTLTVDPAFGTALGAEAATEILSPAKATGIGVIDFPITQGRLLLTKDQQGAITGATGSIWHVGGMGFTDVNGTNTARLRNFRIVLDADPHMSGAVKTNFGSTSREELFDLEFDPANISITGEKKRRLAIEDVVVKLNGESAAALNALFSPAVAFTDGQLVGELDVNTKIVGRR